MPKRTTLAMFAALIVFFGTAIFLNWPDVTNTTFRPSRAERAQMKYAIMQAEEIVVFVRRPTGARSAGVSAIDSDDLPGSADNLAALTYCSRVLSEERCLELLSDVSDLVLRTRADAMIAEPCATQSGCSELIVNRPAPIRGVDVAENEPPAACALSSTDPGCIAPGSPGGAGGPGYLDR
jgi:hypothetical protein